MSFSRDVALPTSRALVAGSAFPLGYTAWGLARSRRIDVIAAFSLFFIVVGAAASLIREMLASHSSRSSSRAFSVLSFSALSLAPRPLMFYIVQEFATGADPRRSHIWSDFWHTPAFGAPCAR